MKTTCENCQAFKSSGQPVDAKAPTGAMYGECRKKSPVVLATYNTPTGGTWQAGWPPTNSAEWCLEFRARLASVSETKSYGTVGPIL